jgi:hypothetical protein
MEPSILSRLLRMYQSSLISLMSRPLLSTTPREEGHPLEQIVDLAIDLSTL